MRSRERNIELALVVMALGFVLLAWRALAAAGVEVPQATERIVLQFAATAFCGHVALRIVAPRASAVPFAVSLMLAAVGLAFVLRLAPEVAQSQANWITLGVLFMVAVAGGNRALPRLRRYSYTSAVAAFALLVITGIAGTTINGARLWLSVGGQLVQTTELIKLLVVVFLAGFLAERGVALSVPRFKLGSRTYSSLPYLLPLLVAVLVLMATLAFLKDLGSVAMLLLLTLAALYLATGRASYVAGGLGLLLLTAAAGYFAFENSALRCYSYLLFRAPFFCAGTDSGGSCCQTFRQKNDSELS